MASTTLPQDISSAREVSNQMTMSEAAKLLSREERFMATLSAMNALLVAKQVYTAEELEVFYVQWAMNQQSKPKRQRPGWRSRILSILTFGT